MAARQRGFTCPQSDCQRPNQPLLQHPYTANTALIEEFPVVREVRRVSDGQLLRKGIQYAYEGLSVGSRFCPITREVDVNASPAQLPIQVPERQKIVGSIQDMNRLALVGDRLDHVQLIEKPPAGRNFRQMLCLVNHDCRRPTKPEGLLEAIAVLASGWLRPRWSPREESGLQILLILNEGFAHLQQQPFEVIPPGETA